MDSIDSKGNPGMDVEAGRHILYAMNFRVSQRVWQKSHSIPQKMLSIPQGFPGNGMEFCADYLGNQLSPIPFPTPRWFIHMVSNTLANDSHLYPHGIHKVIHSLTYHRDLPSAVLHFSPLFCTIIHYSILSHISTIFSPINILYDTQSTQI